MLVLSPKDLANHFRDSRKLRRLSQARVGDEIAVRQDTVSAFELKPENVRLDTLFRLLSALDLEVHIVPKGEGLPEGKTSKGWAEKW